MFRTRAISGAVLVILAFGAIWAGGLILLLTLLAVSVIGFLEMTKATGVNPKRGTVNAYEIIGILGMLGYDAVLYWYGSAEGGDGAVFRMLAAVVIVTLLCLMAVYVLTFPAAKCDVPVRAFFAYLYVPVMLSFIWLIREWFAGFYLVWLVFICSWVSDTCAYLVGRACGKHKLAPVLSPKKSVEGAVGGVLGAALAGFLYGFVLHRTNELALSGQAVYFALIGGVGSVISQIGDLAASGIKRDHELKDYGKLIPGHGGIMDRFDSVIVTAPLIYFLGILFFA